MVESVSTGIPKLDKELINGIPRGFTILVKGSPGSGMELFSKQFASAGTSAENVVYFTTNERKADVIDIMNQYKWRTEMKIIDIATQYFERVLVKELEISRLRRDGLSVAELLRLTDVTAGDKRDEINFLAELLYEVSNLTPPYRLIIDSLDFYLEHYQENLVLSAIRTIKASTYYNKCVALITMAGGMHSQRLESAIEGIVDCVIELEIQKIATEYETRLIVKKVRNYPNKTAIMTYSVTEKGITPEMVSRVL
jgi:KaiC/GvpD/RAD55 family RecA-like ATPase